MKKKLSCMGVASEIRWIDGAVNCGLTGQQRQSGCCLTSCIVEEALRSNDPGQEASTFSV